MEYILSIYLVLLLFGLFYLAYRAIVHRSNAIKQTLTDMNFISGEFNDKGNKVSVKIRDWFTWNVQVNYDKGTAGGNIKINFPIKSTLVLALVCICICILFLLFKVTAYLIPFVFLSFAFYYFLKWYRSLNILKKIQENVTQPVESQIRKIQKVKEGKKLAGVCQGIAKHYGLPVIAVRLFFLLSCFFFLSGVLAYGICIIALPAQN